MHWRSDFWRFFAPTALMSLALASLCASGAVYLYRQQLQSADVLGENIESRRAAGDLEETLHDLVALQRNQVLQVDPILDRVRKHLSVISEFADKPEEKQLSAQAAETFGSYLTTRENVTDEARSRALSLL